MNKVKINYIGEIFDKIFTNEFNINIGELIIDSDDYKEFINEQIIKDISEYILSHGKHMFHIEYAIKKEK